MVLHGSTWIGCWGIDASVNGKSYGRGKGGADFKKDVQEFSGSFTIARW